MTPAERDLVAQLFDRLSTLEDAQRDPEAERLIKDGLRQAPNAVYALVQSVLVQDEALKRADARIRALEQELGPAEPPRQGGFLDNMRGALFGRREEPRPGSVPSVPPVRQGDTPWGSAPGYGAGGPGGAPGGYPGGYPGGAPGGYPGGAPPMGAEPGRPGGSFLGTMAASAAGVIGGSLMLDSIRSMMGNRPGGGHSAFDQASAGTPTPSSPWSGASGGKLAQDAGLNDIGRPPSGDVGGSSDGGDSSGRGVGLLDNAGDDDAGQNDDFGDDMDDGDFGGDDSEE
jgi:hypothetical protein